MAVAIRPQSISTSGIWAQARPVTTSLILDYPESMSVAMSYQYPLPSLGTSGDIPTNVIGPYHLPDPHTQSTVGKPPSPARTWNASMLNKPKPKRSMSTPNAQTHQTADASVLALSAEKRRNKLGYHRTSIACGHCRRRKIRCIPATGDRQKRCTNCIRLKKECVFSPVDQPPPSGGSTSKDGKEVGSAQTSSSPPSPILQQQLSTSQHPFQPIGIHRVGEISEGASVKRETSFSPDSKVTFSRPIDYANSTSWIPSEPSPLVKQSGEVSSTYWPISSQDPPLTPAFSPFTASLSSQTQGTWPVTHAEPSPQEDLGWGVPPQRSMSYGNVEGLSSHAHYSSFQQPPSHLTSRADFVPRTLSRQQSGMYTPSLPTPNSVASAPESSGVSNNMTHNTTTPLTSPFPPSQGWSSTFQYQKQPTIQGEPYAGWYGSNTGMSSQGHGDATNNESSYPLGQGNAMFYPGTTQPPR